MDEATNEHIDAQDDHGILVHEIATASTVLLKNVDCTSLFLPTIARRFADAIRRKQRSHRHFDARNIAPRHEFGLSYTAFEYSGLSISPVTDSSDQDRWFEARWAAEQA